MGASGHLGIAVGERLGDYHEVVAVSQTSVPSVDVHDSASVAAPLDPVGSVDPVVITVGATPRSSRSPSLPRPTCWPAWRTRPQRRSASSHRSAPAAAATRTDRAGAELVPVRLGGAFPVRQLRVDVGSDLQLCPAIAGDLVVQTGQPPPCLGLGYVSDPAFPYSPWIRSAWMAPSFRPDPSGTGAAERDQ